MFSFKINVIGVEPFGFFLLIIKNRIANKADWFLLIGKPIEMTIANFIFAASTVKR
jgi:hypothetical protein